MRSSGWGRGSSVFVPEFMARTQDPSVPDSRYVGFSVPFLGVSGERVYVRRILGTVRAIDLSCAPSFFQPRAGRKWFLLIPLVLLAQGYSLYLSAVRYSALWSSMRGGTRPFSFSLILPGIELIVRAWTWERCTISTRHYLRVVALSDGEVYSLGPVLAAQ